MTNTKIIYGLFDDEEILMKAVKNVRAEGLKIADVLTPFPVHGLDDAMGLRHTRIHSAGFLFGATGTTCALSFIYWVTNVNYPLNFGGKPFLSFPAWIPITFELTVLFAAIGMTLTYLYLNRIAPGIKPRIIDERTTSYLFAMTFDIDANTSSDKKDEIRKVLKDNGAIEIHEKEFNAKNEVVH